MRLHLISHPTCPYVHRAAAMLHEKGVAFEITYIDLRAKPDWFLALSPRAKVPVLVADDVPLFESAVIVEFLDETHPPHIVPPAPLERARQRSWVEIANDALATLKRVTTAPTDAELADAAAACAAVLARFEPELRGPFFAGASIGIVDFAIAPALVRALLIDAWSGLGLLALLPRVEAWAKLLAARPSILRGAPPDLTDRYRALLAERSGQLAARIAATGDTTRARPRSTSAP